MNNELICIVIGVLVSPFVVFILMKVGTVAYYKAKQKCEKENKNNG